MTICLRETCPNSREGLCCNDQGACERNITDIKELPYYNHRRMNFDICTAIDMTRVSVMLSRLKVLGLPKEEAEAYYNMAKSLLSLMRQKNDALHGVA